MEMDGKVYVIREDFARLVKNDDNTITLQVNYNECGVFADTLVMPDTDAGMSIFVTTLVEHLGIALDREAFEFLGFTCTEFEIGKVFMNKLEHNAIVALSELHGKIQDVLTEQAFVRVGTGYFGKQGGISKVRITTMYPLNEAESESIVKVIAETVSLIDEYRTDLASKLHTAVDRFMTGE